MLGSVGRKYFVNYYILGSEGSFVFNFGSWYGGNNFYFLNYYFGRCKYFVTYWWVWKVALLLSLALEMGKEANILLIIILLGSVGRKYFVNYYILGSEESFVFNFGSWYGGNNFYFLNYYIGRCKYFDFVLMGLEGSIALNFWHLRWGKKQIFC